MDEENKVPKNTGEEQDEVTSAEKENSVNEVPANDAPATPDVQNSEEENDGVSVDSDENLSEETEDETTGREVHYEENDNWEFEAEAPTLNLGHLENDNFEIDVPDSRKEKPEPQPVRKPAAVADNANQVVINTTPIKIGLFVFIFVAVVAVLVVLGVRYYTVPNGKEGELMNPGSVAMTVGDTDVSVGTYNYYYSRIVSNYEMYASYGYYDLDTTKDYSKQYTTDDDGNKITWLEMFQNKTIDQIQYVTAYYEAALDDGMTLTSDQKKDINDQLDTLKTSASEASESLDDYIAENYGEYCTLETLETVQKQAYIAQNYYQKMISDSEVPDDEFNAYFKENSKKYYNCDYAFIEMTYDTTSDETKKESVEKAKSYLSKISSVKDMKKIVPDACADLIKQYISNGYFEDEDAAVDALSEYMENTMSSTDTSFGEETSKWLFSDDTKVGDTTYYCDEDNGFIYLILKTGKPKLDESTTYSVRHILIMPGDDTEDSTDSSDTESQTEKKYTDEEWAAAKEKAEKLLAEFNKGDKSEYSFAMLAEKNSDDKESTSSGSSGLFGGMIEGTKEGAMVPEFEKWALDNSRKYGDTGIVKSDYGYHIMFFIDACPQYEYNCKKDIIADRETKFVDKCEVKLHQNAMKKTTVAQPTTSDSSD